MVGRKIMVSIVRIFLWLSLFTIAVQCQPTKRSWIVTIVKEDPYIMLRNPNASGNDRYEGFVVDLLNAISTSLGVDYTLNEVDAIGSFNKTSHRWTGMLGEVVEGRADVAAGPITITAEREAAVDFTVPFMNLGISVFNQHPSVGPRTWIARLFDVFRPFEHVATITFFVLTLVFGIIVLVLHRQYKTIYFRILLGLWVLFLVIFLSIFIALLSSYYAVHDDEYVVKGTEFRDILASAEPTDLVYSCVQGGATKSFFNNADNSTAFGTIWSRMEASDSFVPSNDEGVNFVLKDSNNVFLAESTFVEYVTTRKCQLTKWLGGQLDSKGYGLALPSGSKNRKALNRAILELREKGYLASLKEKWWQGEGCETA